MDSIVTVILRLQHDRFCYLGMLCSHPSATTVQPQPQHHPLSDSALVIEDFVSEEEAGLLYDEVQPLLKRLRYETDHWDGVSRLCFYRAPD